MKSGKLALARRAAMVLGAPASAHAAVTGTVTGDDGNPVALTAGAPLALRNMDVTAVSHVDGRRRRLVARPRSLDPDRRRRPRPAPRSAGTRGPSTTTSTSSPTAATAPTRCTIRPLRRPRCATREDAGQPARGRSRASVAIGQPAATAAHPPARTRSRRSRSSSTSPRNPGADHATRSSTPRAASCRPTAASRLRRSRTAFLNRATGKVQIIGASEPGDYVVVARAKSGDYYTAWSAPITMNADRAVRLLRPARSRTRAARATRSAARSARRAPAARVTVAVAKGKNGKRFRTLGKAKVNSKGVFKLRFTIRKRGTYRLRYSFTRHRDGRPRHDLRGRSRSAACSAEPMRV